MKQKSMVLLAVAGACGLVAMIGVQQLMSNKNAGAAEEPMVTVLVATAEIPARTPIDEANCVFEERPEKDVAADAVTTPEQYEGLAPKTRLFPGDVVTMSKLGTETKASVAIPKGMRVSTVAVNLTKSHSGLITPGDFVDLSVTYQSRSNESGLTTKSKTFMQNIQVFATDSVRADESDGAEEVKAKNISLLVTPAQGNLLKLAERLGEIHLVLRGEGDDTEADIPDFDVADLEEMGAGGLAGLIEKKNAQGDGDGGEPEPGLRSFIDRMGDPGENQPERVATTEPAPEPVAVAEPEPQHEIWTIEIRAGEDVLTEDILVPVEPPEPTTSFDDGPFGGFTTGDADDADRTSEPSLVEAASNGFVSMMKRVLNGSKQDETQENETPRAEEDAGEEVEAEETVTPVLPAPEPAAPARLETGLQAPGLSLGS